MSQKTTPFLAPRESLFKIISSILIIIIVIIIVACREASGTRHPLDLNIEIGIQANAFLLKDNCSRGIQPRSWPRHLYVFAPSSLSVIVLRKEECLQVRRRQWQTEIKYRPQSETDIKHGSQSETKIKHRPQSLSETEARK